MRKHLTAQMILKSASYGEKGIRRWDISDQISLYCSAYDDWYDGPMLWANQWCVHLHWPDKELPYVPIQISRSAAWDLLISKYGEWR